MKSFFKKIIVAILKEESKMILKKYHPRIIAVTGSVGKTSTKDAIFAVLAQSQHVRKSDKSFNSEIGLPLTILGLQNAWSSPWRWVQNILDGLLLVLVTTDYPKWLVLEVGADRPGDIMSLASWLEVDVAVITRLPDVPVHVEFFASPEDVVREKVSLINTLKKDGTLVVYADDQRTVMLSEKAAHRGVHMVTFGLSSAAEVRGEDFKALFQSDKKTASTWPIGVCATVALTEVSVPVQILGVLGKHAFLPVLAAAAVGQTLGYHADDILKGLSMYESPKGRMRLLPGIKGTLLIDDTYNASPAADEAALLSLSLLNPGVRKIAVLGDMLELGRHSVDEHRKVGAIAAKHVDLLVTVGFRAREIAEGALSNGLADSAIFQFEDSDSAASELKVMLREGDCVLIKGSQSIRTEKIVLELMAEPEKAKDLLVRQERDWKKR